MTQADVPLGPADALGVSRRQMTVLFCDLVDSTRLAQRLDPEELLDELASYRGLVQDVATRFGGRVARTVGDGMDIYFGWPLASEDDAVRAIHTGLSIVQEVKVFNAARHHGACLQVRIGVATGWVAVNMHDPNAAIGATLNLAARIQAVAQPGEVAVSPGTRRVAGGQFVYEDLGRFELKGFDAPMTVSAVRGALSFNSRSAWRWRDAADPLVGRQQELATLQAAWATAGQGQRFSVLLSSDAGMGKSRLANALALSLQQEGIPVLRLQCSPFHANSALYPIVQHVRQSSGCLAQDDGALQWRQVEARLDAAGVCDELDRQLIATLMGLDSGDRWPPLAMPPHAQRQMVQVSLARYLAGVGSLPGSQPLRWLLVVEDLHWIDPSSLELMAFLWSHESCQAMGWLMTARPQFTQRQMGPDRMTVLELGGLGREAAAQLVRQHLGEVNLPASAIDAIVSKTDGVPLYIEELSRMVHDQHRLEPGRPGGAIRAIPDTLMDLLMERLDCLGPSKWLAQAASVVGHHCSQALLRDIADLDDGDFQARLAGLLASGLVIRLDAQAEHFIFKHALVADTAYESIPLKLRAQWHGRVADRLTGDAGAQAGLAWEVVARHLTRARRPLQASQAWLQAGRQALGQGAPREAASHLHEGLAALTGLPASAEGDQAQLALLSVLGPTTMVLMGPGSEAFGAIQKQAHALCEVLDRQAPGLTPLQSHGTAPGPRFPITYGLSLYHWGRAELDTARQLAGELRSQAARYGTPEGFMASHNMSGMVDFHLGQPESARRHLERSVGLYEPARDQGLYPVYLMDFGVFGRFYLALATLACGEPERAAEHARDAHLLAGRLNQPHSLGFSMLANMNIACMREEVDTAQDWARRCIDFSSAHGFPEFVAMARIVQGWALARCGAAQAGLTDIEAGIERWRATGFENWQTWFGSLNAQTLVLMGRLDEALEAIDGQLARIGHHSEAQFQSLLMADRAHVMELRGDDPAQVRSLFDRAGELARRQGAMAWLHRIERQRAGGAAALRGQSKAQAHRVWPSINAP